MKKRVYIAGPLFCNAELDFNVKVDEYLNNLGYPLFYPSEMVIYCQISSLTEIRSKVQYKRYLN